jgi:hypothetical protein
MQGGGNQEKPCILLSGVSSHTFSSAEAAAEQAVALLEKVAQLLGGVEAAPDVTADDVHGHGGGNCKDNNAGDDDALLQ